MPRASFLKFSANISWLVSQGQYAFLASYVQKSNGNCHCHSSLLTVHPVVSWESLHVHPLWERKCESPPNGLLKLIQRHPFQARLVIISHWLALIGQGHCIYNSMTSKKDRSWDSDAQAVLCHRILKQSAGKTWHCRGGNFGYPCLDFRHPKPKHAWIFLGWHPQERNPSFNDPSMSLTTWKQSKRWQSNLPVTCLLCGSIFSQTFE